MLHDFKYSNTVPVICTEVELLDEHGLRWRLELPDGTLICRAAKKPLDEAARVLLKAGVNPRATLILTSSISVASYSTNHTAIRGVLHEIAGDASLCERWDLNHARFAPRAPWLAPRPLLLEEIA